MRLDRDPMGGRASLVLVVALAALALAAAADVARPAKTPRGRAVITYVPADTLPANPDVRETPRNLQGAFNNEINAKERYLAYMKEAETEGYPAAARVFHACAEAESVHAHRFVEAIAVTGGQARAVLDKVLPHSTAENLHRSIDTERWEAETYYPALLQRARVEHWPMAARSLAGALATERQHVLLLETTLASLESHPAPVAYFVCSGCGRTVEHRDPGKCPQCFAPSRRYIQVN